MTDQGLVSLFLFLHVGAAIIAFGPTFVFPFVGRLASGEPMHGNFALRVNELIENRLVIPFALTMPVTGLLLIWFAHFDLLNRAFYWLDLAIVLYVIAMIIAIGLQRPLLEKLVHMTTRPAGAPPVAPGPPGPANPPGPPREVAELLLKVQRNGQILGVLLVVIVFLMVVKPSV